MDDSNASHIDFLHVHYLHEHYHTLIYEEQDFITKNSDKIYGMKDAESFE